MGASEFLFSLLNIFLIIVAYATFFNFVAMTFTEITVSTVVGIIANILMFVIIMVLEPIANAEPFSYKYAEYYEGELVNYELEPNPNYKGEEVKKLCQSIIYTMPTGNAEKLSDILSSKDLPENMQKERNNGVNQKILIMYTFSFVVIINCLGIYLFNKEEIK